ncbi:cytochrome P450 [Lentzea alba]|uniref:cytochrome P450 n=1 Tax=Lentzea alba TaxID=2714351 RepID=UPI0039BF9208
MTFPFATNGIDADEELGTLRRTSPVTKVSLRTGGEAWLVTRYADVRQVQADPRFSRKAATKPGTPSVWPDFQISQGLLYLDEPDHSRVRKLVAAAFSPRRIEKLEPQVQVIADRLADELTPPADLFADFAYPLPLLVIAEVLGMPATDQHQFAAWMNVILDATQPPEAIGAAFGGVYGYLAQLMAMKKANPGDDALTALLQTEQLSDDEVLHNVQNLVFAGQEPTSNMIANGVVTLLRHPDQLALLKADPDLTPRAVEELLRYLPTITASPTRVAAVDVEVGGVTIPAGDAVLTVERSANHDDEVFEDAARFDITREPTHLAFGHGPHFCLGAALARLEIATALRTLITRFPELRLAEEQLEWLPNRIVYTPRELQVTW